MQNPSTLVDDLVMALRAIPGVVALLGNPANVMAYKPNYPGSVSLAQRIQEMNPPSILVAHTSTTFPQTNGRIAHQLSVCLRPRGSADALFVAIREGVPTGYGGEKFKRAQINLDCHAPFIQQYSTRFLPISETMSIEYQELLIILTERGADL